MTQFRPRSSLIYSSIVMGICAVIAAVTLITSSWSSALPALGFLAALAAIAYAAYFRPSVNIHADRAELVNVVTIVTVPFSRLESIGTRWALELRADDASKATAFAAPAPGAMKARSVSANEAEWDPDAPTLILSGGPSTSTATASGAAAHMIDDAYRAWKKASPAIDGSETDRPDPASAALDNAINQVPARRTAPGCKAIRRRPNWLSIAVLVAGAAVLVLSS